MTVMSTDGKSTAEIAANSPDPIVRQMAIRRLEIEREIAPLDAFLSFYADQRTTAPVAPPVSPVASSSPPRQPSTRGRSLAEKACMIVMAQGRPLRLQELFDALLAQHPDLCPPKVVSLRPRLAEQRDLIVMVKDRGYWPAGRDVPPIADGT